MKTALWVMGGLRKLPSTLMPSSQRNAIPSNRSGQLSPGQADALAKFVESEHLDPLHDYIKGGRIDPLLVMPELAFSQCTTKLAKLREFAHIIRPLVYASVHVYARSPTSIWAGWSAALALDLFASWTQIKDQLIGVPSGPLLEMQEEKSRLTKLLLYVLREPFYSEIAKSRLDAFKDALREWRLLRPLMETVDTYQELCETVHFYTSAS